MENTDNITLLLNDLKSQDISAQRHAIYELCAIGTPTVIKPVFAALESECIMLGGLRGRRALIIGMGTSYLEGQILLARIQLEQVCEDVQRSVVKMGMGAVDSAIEILKEDWEVTEYSIRALGEIGDELAVTPLIRCFKDGRSISREAARAVEKIGDKAVEHLIKALECNDYWTRYWSAIALGNIGNVKGAIPLMNGFANKKIASSDEIRNCIISALGEIMGKNADERVEHFLIQLFKHDKSIDIKIEAGNALGGRRPWSLSFFLRTLFRSRFETISQDGTRKKGICK